MIGTPVLGMSYIDHRYRLGLLAIFTVSYGGQASGVTNSGDGSSNRRAGVQRYLPGNWSSGRGRGYNRREFVRNSAMPQALCWRCMSKQHQASECYAIDKVCRRCNVKGHFLRTYQKPGIRENTDTVTLQAIRRPTRRRSPPSRRKTQVRWTIVKTSDKF